MGNSIDQSGVLWIARAGVLFPVAIYVLTIAGFWLGLPVTPYHMIAGGILSAGLLLWYSKQQTGFCCRKTLAGTLVAFVYMAAVIGLQSFIHDSSYDGQQYHAEAIIQLTHGFNPIREMIVPNTWEVNYRAVWLNTLANYSWVIGSSVYSLTNDINSTKVLNLYYMPFVALYAYSLASLFISRGWALFLGLLAAFNPVAVTQMFTNYIDGVAYLTLAVAFLALVEAVILKTGRAFIWAVAMSIAALTVKLTSVIPLVAVWLLASVLSASIRSRLFSFKTIGVTALFGILLFYSPYIKNLQRFGNPLYPLRENAFIGVKADYAENIAPSGLFQWMYNANYPPYQQVPRPVAFLMSQFSVTHNGVDETELRLPFLVRSGELLQFRMYDVRINGFGPLFSGVLILAAALLFLVDYKKRASRLLVLIAVLLALTAAFTPQSWWARYVGYFWLVPLLVLLASSRATSKVYMLNYMLAVVLAVNVISIVIIQLRGTHNHFISFHRDYIPMLERISEEGRPWVTGCDFDAELARLREKGVRYVCKRTSSTVLGLLSENESKEAKDLITKAYRKEEHVYCKTHFQNQPVACNRFFNDVFELNDGLSNDELNRLASLFAKPLVYERKSIW